MSYRRTYKEKLLKINKHCDLFVEYLKQYNQDGDIQPLLDTPFTIESINKHNKFVGVTLDGGKEVSVCTEGNINEVMHVVIHEMAHVVRGDTKHDDDFWRVQRKLSGYAIQGGFYSPIGKTKMCGKIIMD